MKFSTVEEAIEEIRNGNMIIVVDDEDRGNEGDLVVAAEKVTGEHINFMAKMGRGLLCTPMERELLEKLDINEMVTKILIIMKLHLQYQLIIKIQILEYQLMREH